MELADIWLERALKDNDKALEYLDKVVTIFPEDEEAHEMIRRIS